MTEEKKRYLIEQLIDHPRYDEQYGLVEDLDSFVFDNELLDYAEYIYAVNTAVELLDQIGNVGQTQSVVELLPCVLNEAIRLLNTIE